MLHPRHVARWLLCGSLSACALTAEPRYSRSIALDGAPLPDGAAAMDAAFGDAASAGDGSTQPADESVVSVDAEPVEDAIAIVDAAVLDALVTVVDASADAPVNTSRDALADRAQPATDIGIIEADAGVVCPVGQLFCSDACVDVSNNPRNCGGCGRTCGSVANASPACVGGECRPRCATGWADCDGNYANGCEINVMGHPSNCGACGRVCGTANANSVMCGMGLCAIDCAPGFGNCDGNPANGCERRTNDDSGCGRCGGACTGLTHCTLNGTLLGCTVLAGGVSCALAHTNCSGRCYNTNNNPFHCGACNFACPIPANATAVCNSGVCGSVCVAGQGNCDGTISNGCEVNLTNNNGNCGRCGVRCPVGTACRQGYCATLP